MHVQLPVRTMHSIRQWRSYTGAYPGLSLGKTRECLGIYTNNDCSTCMHAELCQVDGLLRCLDLYYNNVYYGA